MGGGLVNELEVVVFRKFLGKLNAAGGMVFLKKLQNDLPPYHLAQRV